MMPTFFARWIAMVVNDKAKKLRCDTCGESVIDWSRAWEEWQKAGHKLECSKCQSEDQ